MYRTNTFRFSAIALATGIVAVALWCYWNSSGALNQDLSPAMAKVARLPIPFVENKGQVDDSVAFYLQSRGRTQYFTKHGYILRLDDQNRAHPHAHVIRMDMVGSNVDHIDGNTPTEASVSYFKGQPDDWRVGLSTYGSIVYEDAWNGVQLSYVTSDGRIESYYHVAPDADASSILLHYSGQDELNIDTSGNLVCKTTAGDAIETAPVAWQETAEGRVSVPVAFRLVADDTVAFDLSPYDHAKELVIDPSLTYASYLGGSSDDRGLDVAVDGSGNLYITGYTQSTQSTFPVTTGPDTTHNGDWDAYVGKFNSWGTSITYLGYIGGSGADFASGITIDGSGNAYVVGSTSSGTGFPATVGPDTTFNGGSSDAWVAKVNSGGTSLTYCGFIGGSDYDAGNGIAVDSSGNAYVVGDTASTQSSFPVATGPDTTYNGGTSDAFIAKVNSSGTAFTYCGYIGGSGEDRGNAVAVDPSGNAYVAGITGSTESTFPVTTGPDLTYNLNNDAFVAKVNSSGSALAYCGYVGGDSIDEGWGIALDNSNSAYITGRTSSSDGTFPAKVGPDLTFNGAGTFDVYVAKVNPGGTGLVYAGFIGGSGSEYSYGMSVDSIGSAYVSGKTDSTESSFPVLSGPDLMFNGGVYDAFVAKVRPSGRSLVYAGYIGGSTGDVGYYNAVDSSGNQYVTGNTSSDENSFPNGSGFGSIPGYDHTYNGSGDAWFAKVSPAAPPTAFDYDGDGKSDISVFRPSGTPTWFLQQSTAGYTTVPWGLSTDTIVPGDYDGDGKTDVAVYRSGSTGVWYRYFMGSGSNDSVNLGTTGDVPAPGDFDADGIADCAVFNNGSWNIAYSGGGTATPSFGTTADLPAVGDYDGDGYSDVAVYRPSTGYWYFQGSSVGFTAIQWGNSTDKIVQADYDGDGKTDPAVFRPSTNVWYRYFIGSGTNDAITFGSSGDITAPGDYDGDGKFDIAIFRPSTGYFWKLESSTGSTVSYSFGTSGDQPTENAYVH